MALTLNGTDIAQIIVATGSLVGALTGSAAMLIGLLNKKVINTTAQTVENVKLQTDGLTKQLVASASINAEAVGLAKGVVQEEIRASALKEGQAQAATEAAKIQTDAAKVQAEAAVTQTVAAALQSDAAKKKAAREKNQ